MKEKKNLNELVSSNIQKILRDRNLNQANIAIESGMSTSNMSKKLNGSLNFSLEDISKMLPDTPIVVSPFTPWTKGNGTEGEYDTPVTSRVEFTENNKFITNLREDIIDIVEKNELDIDLHFFDAYSLMLEHNDLKCPDGVHFLPEGYHVLGTAIAERVLDVISNKNDKGE